MEWYLKVAGTGMFRDTICISANPHISSKVPVENFDARDKFKKVYDVWLTDWDDGMPTVRLERVTSKVLEVLSETNGRVIAWYIQPHAPFLTLHCGGANPFPKPTKEDSRSLARKKLSELFITLLPFPLLKYWLKLFVEGIGDEILPPEQVTLTKTENMKDYRRAYRENLELALESVSNIVQNTIGISWSLPITGNCWDTTSLGGVGLGILAERDGRNLSKSPGWRWKGER